MRWSLSRWLLVLQGGLCAARAQGPPPRPLDFQTGRVSVAGNLATIDLPPGWLYLQQSDARHVVERLWGNPPDAGLLGLLVKSADPRWGIRVCFSPLGHVHDHDAHSLDPGRLLDELQADNRLANAERKRLGYPEVELLGWATEPSYDAQRRTLTWATSLRFADAADPRLNYDVRLLGADGVLVLSAVERVDNLSAVAVATADLVPRVQFAAGHRYGDFDSSQHRAANFGVTGLVLGRALPRRWPVWLAPLLGALAVGAGLLVWVRSCPGVRRAVVRDG